MGVKKRSIGRCVIIYSRWCTISRLLPWSLEIEWKRLKIACSKGLQTTLVVSNGGQSGEAGADEVNAEVESVNN